MQETNIPSPQDARTLRIIELEDGEKLTIERITDPNDPRVEKLHEFLVNQPQLSPEEIDPPEVTKAAIEGKAISGEPTTKYIVIVATDEKGEVVACANGAVLHMRDDELNPVDDKAFNLATYVVTDERYQRMGVASETFGVFTRESHQEAKDRNLELFAFACEATDNPDSEKFFNSKGAKGVYIKRGSRSYRRVPYEQPPLAWNPETGEVAEGAGIVPEHLMIRLSSGKDKISGEDLMSIVWGIYEYNNYWFESSFSGTRAYNKHNATIDRVASKLNRVVSGKDLYLFSYEQREALKQHQVRFAA